MNAEYSISSTGKQGGSYINPSRRSVGRPCRCVSKQRWVPQQRRPEVDNVGRWVGCRERGVGWVRTGISQFCCTKQFHQQWGIVFHGFRINLSAQTSLEFVRPVPIGGYIKVRKCKRILLLAKVNPLGAGSLRVGLHCIGRVDVAERKSCAILAASERKITCQLAVTV